MCGINLLKVSRTCLIVKVNSYLRCQKCCKGPKICSRLPRILHGYRQFWSSFRKFSIGVDFFKDISSPGETVVVGHIHIGTIVFIFISIKFQKHVNAHACRFQAPITSINFTLIEVTIVFQAIMKTKSKNLQ